MNKTLHEYEHEQEDVVGSEPLLLSRRRFLQGLGATAVALSLPHTSTQANTTAPEPDIQATNVLPTPPLAVIALNRLGFGPRPGDVSAFNNLADNDDARLQIYVDQQLNPQNIPDTDLETRLAQANFTTLNKSLTQQWTEHRVGDWFTRTMPVRETELAAFMRAIYSRRQLQEVLADFWHNHFNVAAWVWDVCPTFVHYDRDVIRAHMLGNFRQMLEAVSQSPCMLYYLNNAQNVVAGPNENFARELFELHTLGAEHYRGVQNPDLVPVDGQGRPVGYVDEDVYETTRCFTGWTVNETTGAFHYIDTDHDRFTKYVLGQRVPGNQQPLKDGHMVLDLVAYHPGTAVYICRKLCRRLIADRPPERIVQSAAQLFLAQKDSPDQLKQVVRHIILSPEFQNTWGQKIKRPFETIVSALRATNANWTFRVNDDDTTNFFWQYQQAGQPLFDWPAPDGYPDVTAAWQGTNALVMRWRLLNWLVNEQNSQGQYYLDLVGQTPADRRTASQLANFWCNRIFGYGIDNATIGRIRQFMQQTAASDAQLDISGNENIRRRFQTMVAIILQTPHFHVR
jgi:uncharacterized protein (DUF1800 family)